MRRRSAALTFVGVLVGCTSHESLELASPADGATPELSLRERPDGPEVVAPGGHEEEEAEDHRPTPDPIWELSSEDIVVQLEHVPSFALVDARDPFHADGRIPAFTLYEDGTIIYRAHDRLGVWVTWDPRRLAERTVQHFDALGFAQMESHESNCRPTSRGQTCLADAGIVVLRVRVGDELRELRNYAGFAATKEAELHAMYDRIDLLSRATPFGERLYVPERASLWVAEWSLSQANEYSALPWPLAETRLPIADGEERTRWVLEGEELETALDTFGTHLMVPMYFVHGDRAVRAELVPWLPGVDHRDAVATEPAVD